MSVVEVCVPLCLYGLKKCVPDGVSGGKVYTACWDAEMFCSVLIVLASVFARSNCR